MNFTPVAVSAPPGNTVTGPTTRAPLLTITLSPAFTTSGPVKSPAGIVRVKVGAWKGVMTTDSLGALQADVAELFRPSPL